MRAFITVIGKDKIGIIHEITTVLREERVNVLDINQTLIQDYFSMIMLVDFTEAREKVDFAEAGKNGFMVLKTALSEVEKRLGPGMSIRVQHEDLFKAMHTL